MTTSNKTSTRNVTAKLGRPAIYPFAARLTAGTKALEAGKSLVINNTGLTYMDFRQRINALAAQKFGAGNYSVTKRAEGRQVLVVLK